MIDDPGDQPMDPQVEETFRRGYVSGASEVIYLLSHKLSAEELALLRAWTEGALWSWGLTELERAKRPPEFPTLPGQRSRTLGMWFPD